MMDNLPATAARVYTASCQDSYCARREQNRVHFLKMKKDFLKILPKGKVVRRRMQYRVYVDRDVVLGSLSMLEDGSRKRKADCRI
jgi:hypothetical protein